MAPPSAGNTSVIHFEPEVNNEILNLLVPAMEKKKVETEERRPDFYVEDKVAPDQIQVVEMQPVDVGDVGQPQGGADLDSNDIALADQAPTGFHPPTAKKMSIHIGEDAVLFLNKVHETADPTWIDVSKIKPTFKWKIGQWTRVCAFGGQPE